MFGKRGEHTGPERMVRDRTYDDLVLDAALAELAEGKLAAAVTVLAECRSEPEVRALRADVLGTELIGQAEEVVTLARETGDPDLWLLGGRAFLAEAWAVRGGGRAERVSDDRRKLFHATLRKAVVPLQSAAERLPRDPVPWASLMVAAMGLGLTREQKDGLWREVAARYPTLWTANCYRVQILARKWGGDATEMLAFARGCADRAPQGDPVSAMVVLAHFEVYLECLQNALEARDRRAIVRLNTHYFAQARDEIAAAADRWMCAPRPHPRALEAHNLFAAAFGMADDASRARLHLTAMGDRLHDIPWGYLGLGVEKEYRAMAEKYL
ncbi:hypothetical protein GCM10012275_46420 [Longimycelium tulufanense]|uniref:DUF4034 domain-containing protein n=1 Tax=Longimycelium tulufanense TaxID=907463 RepID=A0A8J3CHL6_9PSEU|nr:hypothetical protein GCM10012275_46420 [Longimycelium tulufanense]